MTNGDVILKLVEMLLSEKEKAFELMKNDKKNTDNKDNT